MLERVSFQRTKLYFRNTLKKKTQSALYKVLNESIPVDFALKGQKKKPF